MKRFLVLLALPLALGACKKGEGVNVNISEDFQSTRGEDRSKLVYEKIAVFPFMSALHYSDDPDGVAPATMEMYFVDELNLRKDYNFISANTVRYAIDQQGLQDRYNEFVDKYPRTNEVDPEFLSSLATALQCDAFLVPVVDTWEKDEVDVQENSTPATYVGATLIVLDGTQSPGTVLFRAVHDDYQEGARSETSDRTVMRSASGHVRSDPGAKAYAAPGFQDVAPSVIRVLVASLPAR
jgi:hypothetical protein